MNELALFAGAGGGILGGKLLGWRTVCAVEFDRYARSVLMARQNDGCLGSFPIWDDVRTFDGKPWRGIVDVVSGGFPCQDISTAGKGAGIIGERSGLWKEFARIIGEVGPRFVLVENSPALTSRGLGTVLGDLASLGYNAKWGVLGAHHVGAPHKRDRIWIVANSAKLHRNECFYYSGISVGGKQIPEFRNGGWTKNVANTDKIGCGQVEQSIAYGKVGEKAASETEHGFFATRGTWWSPEPRLGRVANGVADRVDRLRAIGNGQVPAVVELAWEALT